VSQVAAKRKIDLHSERVKVTGRFHEQGSVLRGDAEGFCDGFEVEIRLESDAPAQAIAELVRLARQMCFTEQALAGNTSLSVRPVLNGQPMEQ
jgi:uncharacterized OsmC-like protein